MFTCSCSVGKKQVPLSMAIGNMELMQECFPKHSRMGAARTKYGKETDEEGNKRRENGKKQSRHEKKEVLTAYHVLILI